MHVIFSLQANVWGKLGKVIGFSFWEIAMTLEVKLQLFFLFFKDVCAVTPHKCGWIRKLLPALITPEKTALREKTVLATITPCCYRACRHLSGALLRFISVKLKWQRIDHRFNWDQMKHVHFLSFLTSKSRMGTQTDYHVQTHSYTFIFLSSYQPLTAC